MATALREAGHEIALTRGISTVRAGAVVRKSSHGVRVYYAALVSSPATVDRMLREYTATLRGAGFEGLRAQVLHLHRRHRQGGMT